MAGQTAGSTPSLIDRAFRLIEALPGDGSPASVGMLAERTGLPVSTSHRIVGELVRLGQLERRSDGRVVAGTRLWELGERAPLVRRLRESAQPELNALYDRTGENAHLAVLVGSEVLYLARATGERAVPTLVRVGVRHPIHATGVGRAILARHAVVAAGLPDTLERVTAFTITDRRRLLADLALTRERGYAVTRQEMTLGNASIAVALEQDADLPPAAIGLVTHLATADERRLAPLLLRAAETIRSRLDSTE